MAGSASSISLDRYYDCQVFLRRPQQIRHNIDPFPHYAVYMSSNSPSPHTIYHRPSGRRDSNPRPTAWKAVTLPTELLPQCRFRDQSRFSGMTLPTELLPQQAFGILEFGFWTATKTPSHFKARNSQSKFRNALTVQILKSKFQDALMWAGEDSNLRRHEPTDLQSVAFDRFATCPTSILNWGI
jgi:hypothetical protein